MIRIVKLHFNDLVCGRGEASDAVNAECSRKTPAKVTGLFTLDENVYVILESIPEREPVEYVFASLLSLSEDDIVSEISSRYYEGFTTVGSFQVGDDFWTLYGLRKDIKKTRSGARKTAAVKKISPLHHGRRLV
jgi:hypothetical protein